MSGLIHCALLLSDISICFRHLVNLEMRLVADRAALRVLQECSVELQERVSKAAHDKGQLITKYQKIQHFKELTVSAGLPPIPTFPYFF